MPKVRTISCTSKAKNNPTKRAANPTRKATKKKAPAKKCMAQGPGDRRCQLAYGHTGPHKMHGDTWTYSKKAPAKKAAKKNPASFKELSLMTKHPPRVRKSGKWYLVEVFSTVVGKYIVQGEFLTAKEANADLKIWKDDHKRVLSVLKKKVLKSNPTKPSRNNGMDRFDIVPPKGKPFVHHEEIFSDYPTEDLVLDFAKQQPVGTIIIRNGIEAWKVEPKYAGQASFSKTRSFKRALARAVKQNPSDLPKPSLKFRAKKTARKAAEGAKEGAKRAGRRAASATKDAAKRGGRKAAEMSKDAAVWTGKKIAKGGKRAGRKAWGTTKEAAKGTWSGIKKGWKENPTAAPKSVISRIRRLEHKALELYAMSDKETRDSEHYYKEAEKLMHEAQNLAYEHGVDLSSTNGLPSAWNVANNPITAEQRKRMSLSLFALPKQRKYRLDSPARNKYSLTLLNKHYKDGVRTKTDYANAYVNIMVAFIKNGQVAKRPPKVKTAATQAAYKATAARTSAAARKTAMQSLLRTCKAYTTKGKATAANCKAIEARIKKLGTAKRNPSEEKDRARQKVATAKMREHMAKRKGNPTGKPRSGYRVGWVSDGEEFSMIVEGTFKQPGYALRAAIEQINEIWDHPIEKAWLVHPDGAAKGLSWDITRDVQAGLAVDPDIYGSRKGSGYELVYGTGGHGGPYATIKEAKQQAERLMRGQQSEIWIAVVPRDQMNILSEAKPSWYLLRDRGWSKGGGLTMEQIFSKIGSRRGNPAETPKGPLTKQAEAGLLELKKKVVEPDNYDGTKYSPVSVSRCLCGAPTTQQPCETCGFYPYGDDPQERKRVKDTATRERFVRSVKRSGGLGPWWLIHGYKQTVAYQNNYNFKDRVDRLIEAAKTMPWPDPGELWDEMATKSNPRSRRGNPTLPKEEKGYLDHMVKTFLRKAKKIGRDESGYATEIPWLVKSNRNMRKLMPVFYGLPEAEQDAYIEKAIADAGGNVSAQKKWSKSRKANPTKSAQQSRVWTTNLIKSGIADGKVYFGKDVKGRDLSVGPYHTATAKRKQYALFVGNLPVQVMSAGDAAAHFMALAMPDSIRPAGAWQEGWLDWKEHLKSKSERVMKKYPRSNPSKDILHFAKKGNRWYVLHGTEWISVKADFAQASIKSGQGVKVPWSHGKLAHHKPTDIVDDATLGIMLHQWHWGQNDPIYAAGSTLFSGSKTSTAMLSRALNEISSLKQSIKSKAGSGSNRSVRDLTLIEKNLEERIGKRRSRAAVAASKKQEKSIEREEAFHSLDLSDPMSRMAFMTSKRNPVEAGLTRSTKVPAVSITVTRTEGGNHDLNEPHEVVGGDVWNKANVLLSLWGREAKEGEQNKVKYHIRYSDGETYSGTYYVGRKDQVSANLGRYMSTILKAAAGKAKPSYMTKAQYDAQKAKLSAAQRKRYADFLKKYEVGSAMCNPCRTKR